MEVLSLIDVSAEDDLLLDLASPPPHPDPPHAGSSGVAAEVSYVPPAGGSPAAAQVQMPERSESPKQRKPKSGLNLRKSLAWDSAFLTSEGVLDTEELSIVNSAFLKTQGSRLLPGIAEEMRRSGDSTTSTLESESFTMETPETELFENVRASIQRTLGKPGKAPAVTGASSKLPRVTANVPPVAARKGVDRIPQTKIRPPVSASHGVGGKQRTQVTLKEPTAARVKVLPGAAEAKLSSRPPRALPRVATMRGPTNIAATSGIADKRSSTGGVANKQAVGKSANTSGSMQPRPGGATKSASTSKSGALASAAISSSRSVSMGTAGAKTKSPTLINKNRTAQRVPIPSSPRSDTSKVNPARASRSQIPTKSHGEHASPSISPSSSMDSMSSVISGFSTASTVGRMSHTSESFSTRSSSLSPSLRKSNDCPPTTKLRPPVVVEGQSTESASGDDLKGSKDRTMHGTGWKPSGLRRPTPKIGYFDAEKSIDQTIGAQVHVQPAKVQYSPAAPNTMLSSSQKSNPASCTFGPQESNPATVPQEEINPSQATALPSLQLGVAPLKEESSKVTEDEACIRQTEPVVAVNTATENMPALYQNTQAVGDVTPLRVELSSQKIGFLDDASPLTVGLMIQKLSSASKPTAEPDEESCPSQTKESPAVPLGLVQEVTEHEECVLQTIPVEATENILSLHNGDGSPLKELALHQNIQPSCYMSPLTMLTQKLSSISLDESINPEAHAESSLHEACVLQIIPEVAKENIPALHQNIQDNGDLSPSKENILVLHQNKQVDCEMSPLTLLTQKLSSVSLSEAADTFDCSQRRSVGNC